jgi:hypothetical protein
MMIKVRTKVPGGAGVAAHGAGYAGSHLKPTLLKLTS